MVGEWRAQCSIAEEEGEVLKKHQYRIPGEGACAAEGNKAQPGYQCTLQGAPFLV